MVIKSADDRSDDIAALNALLAEATLTRAQRVAIKEQLHNLEKGAWGEQTSAYFINFHFAGSQNNIVLHDLRVVLSDGRTAQIDHLIINRMMFIYVLETKNWNQLTVDKEGICTTWAGRVVGVESPLEQYKRHVEVLNLALQGSFELRALARRFKIIPRVIVAPNCNLRASYHREWYLKADHFHAAWEKEFNDVNFVEAVVGLSRMVSREALIKLGHELGSLHHPSRTDWRARFGITSVSEKVDVPANQLVSSIEGLADYVPRWGEDWFVLQGRPTEQTKKKLNSAGYRASKENGDWVWRLRR